MSDRPTSRLLQGMRLAAYGGAYFFAAGAFMSYWPVWLRDRGVSDTEIGTLFMSRQIVAVIATLSVGWIAHRLGGPRGVIVALGIGAIVMMGAYQFSYSFLAIFVVTMIWGFLWSPPMPLYDGVLVTETKKHGLDYARVRMWSSVAFIFGTFIAGIAVDRYGPPWVLYVGMASIVLLAPLALLLPAAAPRAAAAAEPGHAPFRVADLLRQPAFLLFLLACGLCQASHSVLYSFGTLTWRGAGIDDVTISALWAESVAIEIVLMLFGGWLLGRLGVCGLIALGLAAGLVRWTAMAFTTELWALVLLQALHSCTFAACHLGAMAFLQRALPAHGAAIGQSLYYALGTGATQAVVYQFSGILYSEYGQRAFLGMTVVSAIGMCAVIALARTWNGGLLVGHTQVPLPR
ncbi:MFS transporter [Reyranella sp. MMS21-HV4-11]|uniref:MFS transporter n=1 Tax=Reyranella humidisoli TaxID=2849149 RepID=A0ABS6IRS5_9HYPH|nr:MFS transporter [Reyranella sp. MMS21-HV4-11]MBU8877268.1 MFS transporter [Reyranella sp. MMS21-HV4-11]